MKKLLALLLSMTLVVAMFTGCGKKETAPEETTKEETTKEETTEEETTGGNAKTGLAVVTSLAKTDEEKGLAQIDSTVAAVLVDADGKILDVAIDTAQTKVNFSKEGKITTDLATVFASKQDLGAEHGMAKASSIGKEWNEQANVFADYAVGKTIDELKGIALTEEGTPADADLAASVTVEVGGYIAVIEKAVANAKEIGAQSTDKIGLALSTTIDKSADAGEKEGLAQAYTNYSVVTINADGKITSAIIDASQSNVNFTTEGKITTDLASAPQTKQELGEAYGMKKVSAIGKEWNEQADAFASYVIGKTADEVKGIALTDDGLAADADLISSVTVHVGPFMANTAAAVNKAAQ